MSVPEMCPTVPRCCEHVPRCAIFYTTWPTHPLVGREGEVESSRRRLISMAVPGLPPLDGRHSFSARSAAVIGSSNVSTSDTPELYELSRPPTLLRPRRAPLMMYGWERENRTPSVGVSNYLGCCPDSKSEFCLPSDGRGSGSGRVNGERFLQSHLLSRGGKEMHGRLKNPPRDLGGYELRGLFIRRSS